MALSKNDIEDRLDKGEIQCLVSLQVVGKPKEHVEKSLQEYIDLIEKEKAIEVIRMERLDAEELEDQEGFFSALAEVEMMVPGLTSLIQIAYNLSPASIEILEPQEFLFEGRHLQNWLNDLLSILHTMAGNVRGERQRANHLSRAVTQISKNFIAVLLTSGPKDTDTLKRLTGLDEKPLQTVLENQEEAGVIARDGTKWILKSSDE